MGADFSDEKLLSFSPELITRTARRLMDSFARVSRDAEGWLPANPAEFSWLDLGWYDEARRVLERCKFRQVGDVRLAEAPAPDSPVLRSFARKAVSADGVVQADVFQVKRRDRGGLLDFLKTWRRYQGTRAVVFNTEFTDGTFQCTTNTPENFNAEPGFFRQFVPADSPVPAQLKKHLEAVQAHMRQRAGVRPVLVRSLEQQLASENRAKALRAVSRRQRTMTVDEIVRLGGQPEMAPFLVAEMERLRAVDALRAAERPLTEQLAEAVEDIKNKVRAAGITEGELSPEAEVVLRGALAGYEARQEVLQRNWKLADNTGWAFDPVRGELRLSFRRGPDVLAKAQVLGTYSEAAHSFEWAWNSPQLKDFVHDDAETVRALGEKLRILYLQTGMIPMPLEAGLSYVSALALKACGAEGIFRGSTGDLHTFLSLRELRFDHAAPGAPDQALTESLGKLVQEALRSGIQQVKAVGSPLNPFLLTDRGELLLLMDASGADPMALALAAIARQPSPMQACALVMDTRVALQGSAKQDAIMVMACEQGAPFGEAWVQCYRPKKWWRGFREAGAPERLSSVRNFLEEALKVTHEP